MKFVKITNSSNLQVSPIKVWHCNSFFSRFRGLMLKKDLRINEGALLVQGSESRMGSSIHMLFMNFDLGIIWINAEGFIVDKKVAKRWQLSSTPQSAAMFILEIHPDRLIDFSNGDKIQFDYE